MVRSVACRIPKCQSAGAVLQKLALFQLDRQAPSLHRRRLGVSESLGVSETPDHVFAARRRRRRQNWYPTKERYPLGHKKDGWLKSSAQETARMGISMLRNFFSGIWCASWPGPARKCRVWEPMLHGGCRTVRRVITSNATGERIAEFEGPGRACFVPLSNCDDGRDDAALPQITWLPAESHLALLYREQVFARLLHTAR